MTCPLTGITGIDVYERSRLNEEGITNLQGLVHYDIITLMLKSRISSARIVDWVDQAILELHISKLAETHQAAVRTRINNRGIRNTTDFMLLYGQVEEAADETAAVSTTEATPTSSAEGIQQPTDTQNDVEATLEDICQTIQDDEWYRHVRYWRNTNITTNLDIFVDDNGQIHIGQPTAGLVPINR